MRQSGPYVSREVRTGLAHAVEQGCHWLATVESCCVEGLGHYPYYDVSICCWRTVTGLVHALGLVYHPYAVAIGYSPGAAPGQVHVAGVTGSHDAEESPSTACVVAAVVLPCQPYPELSVGWTRSGGTVSKPPWLEPLRKTGGLAGHQPGSPVVAPLALQTENDAPGLAAGEEHVPSTVAIPTESGVTVTPPATLRRNRVPEPSPPIVPLRLSPVHGN